MGFFRAHAGLVAVATSLVLHVAVFAWVSTHQPIVPKPHEVTGEFAFVEVEVPPLPAKVAEQPKVEPPPPKPVTRPPPVRPVREPVVTAPPPDAPPATDVPTEPSADVPRVVIDAPRAPKLNPALLPSGTFALSLDAGVLAVDPDEPRGLHGFERQTDLVGLVAKETIGRGRVDRGLVHPYYSQLGKMLVKNWDADRVAKSGLKGLVEQTGENFKLANEIWLDRAAAFAKSGSPIDAEALGTNRRAPVSNQIQGISGVDLDARKELQRQMTQIYKATRRATIRVVQDRGGKLVKVELVDPSNDQNVDREALKDVRSAAEKLPPPPDEVFEGKDQLSSLWSFELIVSISPPIPTVTFEFDEALGFIDTRLPLDRRIYKKVRLMAVE